MYILEQEIFFQRGNTNYNMIVSIFSIFVSRLKCRRENKTDTNCFKKEHMFAMGLILAKEKR